MIIHESAINSTVCISAKLEDGKKHILGSGFVLALCIRKLENGNYLNNRYLITSKHVIDKHDEIIISFGNSNDEITLKIREYSSTAFFYNESIWFGHESEDCDIALILINPDLIQEKCKNYNNFYRALTISKMKDKDISEGDPIFVLGFPKIFKNNRGEEQKILIARDGIIANISNIYSRESQEFILDVSCFPGNSGGPVVLNPKLNNEFDLGDEHPLLVGIITSYWAYREKAISDQSFEEKVLFEDNSGLASAYPIDYVFEIEKFARTKLKEHVKNLAYSLKQISSESDLKTYFLKNSQELIKNQIKVKLNGITSEEAIERINKTIKEDDVLAAYLLEYFINNDLEIALNNFRGVFEYEYINEFISKKESKKILELLNKWESELKPK